MAAKQAKTAVQPNAAPNGTLTATVTDAEGQTVAVLMLEGKAFKTGNTGYFGSGKAVVGGRRYQAQAQFAAIREK